MLSRHSASKCSATLRWGSSFSVRPLSPSVCLAHGDEWRVIGKIIEENSLRCFKPSMASWTKLLHAWLQRATFTMGWRKTQDMYPQACARDLGRPSHVTIGMCAHMWFFFHGANMGTCLADHNILCVQFRPRQGWIRSHRLGSFEVLKPH